MFDYSADIAYAKGLRDQIDYSKPAVDWSEKGLKITRLRLLSDPGFPFWDVSYCYGELNGEQVEVRIPFSQLPKYGYKAALIKEAKRQGLFIKGLVDKISTLC